MRTRIITSLDDLNALRDAWRRLEQRAVSPMQQFIWTQACSSAFAQEGELRVVVVEEDENILAVAPLVHHRDKPYLEILGVAEINEPTDVLFTNGDALKALAKALVEMSIPLLLNRLPADSHLVKALKNSFRGRGVLFSFTDNSWPFIPLESSWVEPESHLNSGRRSDLRRSQRIAAEIGRVSSEVLSPAPLTLASHLEETFAVEAASWKGELRTAMALDPVRGAFYRQYAASACEKGILRLCFLRIGGKAAAMQMAVESGGRMWLLRIGYDKQFAHCSPGILLLRETLRDAAVLGLNSFEFLGSAEPWIRAWTCQERPCVSIRGYPFGLRGMKRLANDAVTSIWNKLGRVKQRPR